MQLPLQTQLDRAAADFERDWGGVDELLYGLCHRCPGHGSRRQVTAKAALIDRAYSAGLERQVIPDPGEQAITKIAAFLVCRGGESDRILETLSPLCEPLGSGAMAEIVGAHGRLTELLRQIPTRGTVPRSFAAK